MTLAILATQATLYFRSLHFTKSVVASQFCVQQKPREKRAAAIHFLDSKGDRRDGQFVMTHIMINLPAGNCRSCDAVLHMKPNKLPTHGERNFGLQAQR